jgi:hypothetical protein
MVILGSCFGARVPKIINYVLPFFGFKIRQFSVSHLCTISASILMFSSIKATDLLE